MSESGGGPYHERRSSSERFLPPDPRVREPHRLTRALAVRVAVLGGVALLAFGILFLRLWSLQVLSGDEYLNAAQNNQLRLVRVEAPRGPILDRRGRAIVSNVAGTAVQLWTGDMPKEGRYELVRRLAKVLNVSPAALAREVEERRGDPVTPILVKSSVGEEQVNYLYEHQAEFPGVEIVQVYLRDYAYNTLAAQILGLRRRDLPRGAQAAEEGRLPRRRPHRQGGCRGCLRHVPARAGRPCPDPRRLARPAAVRARAAAGAESGIRPPAHAGRALAACGRGSAPLRDRPRPPDRQLGRERRRDRRARPRRRGRAGDGFLADVQAVGLRRAHRSEEARAAPGRGGGASRELPGPEPRHRRALSARIDVEAGHRARRDAGARLLGVRLAPVLAGRLLRPRPAALPQLEPVRQPADDAPGSARRVVRHLLLPDRRSLLSARLGGSGPHAAVGAQVRFRPGDGARHRRRGGRPPADAELALEDVRERLGPRLEPRRLDPALDRPEGPARDPAPDGRVLRDARERRGRRDAVCRVGRRAAASEGIAAGRSPPLRAPPAAILRHRSPLRSTRSATGSSAPRTPPPARRQACSGATRSRSRARRGLPRRSFRFRAIRATTWRTSRGGAAGGRRTTRRSSSAR